MTYIPETKNRSLAPVLFLIAVALLVPISIHLYLVATTEQVNALPPGLIPGLDLGGPAAEEVSKFWNTDIWSKQLAIPCILAFSVVVGIIPGTLGSGVRRGFYTFLKVVLTFLMFLLIIPVTLQVLSRNPFIEIPRYIWTEEIARFCFVWIVMIGAMIAVEDDSHFDVDLLPAPKTLQGRGWSKLIVHGAMMLIAVNFIIFGYDFAETAVGQLSEISELPMIFIYIAWPMAGVIWTIFLSTKIFEDIQRILGVVPYPDTQNPTPSDQHVPVEEVL